MRLHLVAVTPGTDRLEMDMLVNVATLTNVMLSTQHTTVMRMPPVVIPSEVLNANVMPVTLVTVLKVLVLISMNVKAVITTATLTQPALIPSVVSLAHVTLAGILVETDPRVHVIMLMSVPRVSTRTFALLTPNVSITKVPMTANACHHTICPKVHVSMMMNVPTTVTIVTKVDQSVLMKPRHIQWNG